MSGGFFADLTQNIKQGKIPFVLKHQCNSRAGGMVDTRDLKSRGRKVRESSSLSSGTIKKAHDIAGWSSLEARRAHNPKVNGSNPFPATNHSRRYSSVG